MAHKFDIVFLQRATFLFGLEKLLYLRKKNIIFDIDDPIYLLDREEQGIAARIKRYTKKKEVISILRIAKSVIVENRYIKDFVQAYSKDVHLIVGPIDALDNFPKRFAYDSGCIKIGWIGTPSTAVYLERLNSVLQQLAKNFDIKLRLIGSGFYSLDGLKVECVEWNEKTQIKELHEFDIGIMPMPDNEWTRGKVGCKMLQYMANGIPAVVSYTPTTADIIEDGVNGFLAKTEENWLTKLSLLIKNPELRQKIGMAGRKTVKENFSLDASIPRYIDIFKSCL